MESRSPSLQVLRSSTPNVARASSCYSCTQASSRIGLYRLAASSTLDGFRVIRVRRAGYGATVPGSHLAIEDHARHLTALAALLELKAVHVVGHSSGALIAAFRSPPSPSRLISAS